MSENAMMRAACLRSMSANISESRRGYNQRRGCEGPAPLAARRRRDRVGAGARGRARARLGFRRPRRDAATEAVAELRAEPADVVLVVAVAAVLDRGGGGRGGGARPGPGTGGAGRRG